MEKTNFQTNPDDTGECWFSDNDAEEKMIEFLFENMESSSAIRPDSSICDLGTGNGHFLFQMQEEGFQGDMVGLDYSLNSVNFSTEISRSKGLEQSIRFKQCDILHLDPTFTEKYDILVDKGTFDAIALSEAAPGEESGTDIYPKSVGQLLLPKGVLLITSCNFTEEELVKKITQRGFQKWKSVKYPVFEFGGVTGQTICTVAFVKV